MTLTTSYQSIYYAKNLISDSKSISVALIIGLAIGIGQYRPLSGKSAACLDLAYRYFWYLCIKYTYELIPVIFPRISIINVPN